MKFTVEAKYEFKNQYALKTEVRLKAYQYGINIKVMWPQVCTSNIYIYIYTYTTLLFAEYIINYNTETFIIAIQCHAFS